MNNKPVDELEGDELDYWVARAIGLIETTNCNDNTAWTIGEGSGCFGFYPSMNWSQCGPLIERLGIGLSLFEGAWRSRLFGNIADADMPLIAVCRVIVKSNIGDMVPSESENSNAEDGE